MYRSLFPRDPLAELERLQRDMSSLFDHSPSIRGVGRSGFPALNVGSTPDSFEIFAFAPGIDPASIDVRLERGVLTIDGERKPSLPDGGAKQTLHINERFDGRFRRVVSLPEDIDPNAVSASYRDGLLQISVNRRAAPQARRIEVH